MVNNAEWLRPLNYLAFLRDVGRHFSVNRMLSFDSVKQRLDREQSLSFLEFNYMILQAYDFVELNQRYGVRLQMGGSDQWGNIVNGIDLGHRLNTPQLFALTTPLLTTASGAKMGKSMTGAVWLNAEMLGALAESLPTVNVPRAELETGIGALALFVRAGLAASNGEARRQVQGGGLRVNDAAVSDDRRIIRLDDATAEGVIKLSLGKKKHVLVRAD